METAFRSEERFTQSQFFDWLQERPRSDINHYELLGGHIVMTPPAGYPHGTVEAQIVAALVQHAGGGKLGSVNGSSAGYDLPSGDTVEPDVSFVSAATLTAGPRPRAGKFYQLVPDLMVEILSPATSRRDRTEKKRIYEKNGVAEYWIVSPERRHVTLHALEKGKYAAVTVVRGHVESRLLPGLRVPLETIFADCD